MCTTCYLFILKNEGYAGELKTYYRVIIKLLHKYKCMDWVQLDQDEIQWRAPKNTVIHLETVKRDK